MNTYTRRPEWSVTIRRPDYTKPILFFKFVPEWSYSRTNVRKVEFVSSVERSNGVNILTDLTEYEFENQLSNPAGPFTLTFVPIADLSGLTWKDKITENDIVYISEFGEVKYIGIVTGTGYSMSLSNGDPVRKVIISGMSIGGKLQTFNVPMNKYLWFGKGVNVETKNDIFIDALTSRIDEGQKLGGIFKLIKDGFLDVMFGQKTSGFVSFLDEFFDLEVDNLEAFYPLLLRPFQQDSNTLWQIYRQVLPNPVYEIFGRFEDNKYKMICRETPFDFDDWNNLRINFINPLYLISQDLNDSDGEVYTHYMSQMPNSAFSPNEIYADNSLHEITIFDEEKLAIYGYRQLMANFPFFDLAKGRAFSSKEFLKQNSVRMYAWYRNNLEFQSGTITMHTVKEEYAKIGERFQYMQGSNFPIEFYIEGVKRKMVYPETMTSTYSVTRGYEYGSKTDSIEGRSFKTPQVKKITQLGRKLIQTEKNIFQRAGKT